MNPRLKVWVACDRLDGIYVTGRAFKTKRDCQEYIGELKDMLFPKRFEMTPVRKKRKVK